MGAASRRHSRCSATHSASNKVPSESLRLGLQTLLQSWRGEVEKGPKLQGHALACRVHQLDCWTLPLQRDRRAWVAWAASECRWAHDHPGLNSQTWTLDRP